MTHENPKILSLSVSSPVHPAGFPPATQKEKKKVINKRGTK
jgi:hypothetical protein